MKRRSGFTSSGIAMVMLTEQQRGGQEFLGEGFSTGSRASLRGVVRPDQVEEMTLALEGDGNDCDSMTEGPQE